MSNQVEFSIDKEVMNQLIWGFNEFGLNIFQELTKANGGENVIISPASIALALSLIYNGSGGDTQDSLAAALGYQDMTNQQVNAAIAEVLTHWRNLTPGITLNLANSLWVNGIYEINEQFLNDSKEIYEADVNKINFDSSKSLEIINDWVNEKTKGKIESIIERFDPLSLILVLNAIYFKGIWSSPFNIADTKENNFFLSDGQKKRHPMMSQMNHFRCRVGLNYKSICLPYGKDKRVGMVDHNPSMYIFLPNKQTSLTEFTHDLYNHQWEGMMAPFHTAEYYNCSLVLPRFKIEYEETLNDAINQLGMGDMFDPDQADFRRIFKTPAGVFINQVKHKTFIEVNEEGTEAAAVTSIGVTMGGPPKKFKLFDMVVNRPFLFMIRDNKTGAILFLGSIYNPK